MAQRFVVFDAGRCSRVCRLYVDSWLLTLAIHQAVDMYAGCGAFRLVAERPVLAADDDRMDGISARLLLIGRWSDRSPWAS